VLVRERERERRRGRRRKEVKIGQLKASVGRNCVGVTSRFHCNLDSAYPTRNSMEKFFHLKSDHTHHSRTHSRKVS